LAQKRAVEKLIAKAKRRWGVEDWTITFKWGDLPHEAEIDPINATLKQAVITIDRETVKTHTKKYLEYLVTHEVGHVVLAHLWRGVTDWVYHKIGRGKEREIFEEAYNTRENEILDHIIARVMKMNVNIDAKPA